jgi:hypothetical protein
MIYTGRHPCGGFLRDGNYNDYVEVLQPLYPGEPRSKSGALARKRWDICCHIVEQIKLGAIKPIRPAFQSSGDIDIVRTIIKTSDLVDVATSRGERPRHLRHLQIAPQSSEPTGRAEDELHALADTQMPRRPPGPKFGTVSHHGAADRALFPDMDRLVQQGASIYGAALKLARDGRVSGDNTTDLSKARRLERTYREHVDTSKSN